MGDWLFPVGIYWHIGKCVVHEQLNVKITLLSLLVWEHLIKSVFPVSSSFDIEALINTTRP